MAATNDKRQLLSLAKVDQSKSPSSQPSEPVWRSVVAGSVGGLCATLIGHPFESVKVRLQTGQTTRLFSNIYAGILSPIVGVTPLWALSYFSYRGCLGLLPTHEMTTLQAGSIAGALSGICSVVVKTPVEAVKVVAQSNHSSVRDAMRLLMKEKGLAGLYRGNLATSMHMGPSQAGFFATYELSKEFFKNKGFGEGITSFLAGGMAGMVEWTFFFPTDTVKTRIQTTPGLSIPNAWRQIFRESGVRGFYRGYLPTLLRAFPANGAGFFGIELANRTMAELL